MYKVYSDSNLIYSDAIESLKITQPKIDLELNKTGAFEFTIYPTHPYYNLIYKMKSIITVYQDDYMLFRGRVLNDELGFYDEKHVQCEGDLAFFLDSMQRPYDYSGSIEGFLEMLIQMHNEQVEESHQFTLGNVTVTDANDTIARSDIEYVNTLEVIEKKLVELLGGYILIRHEDNINYVDYLEDFDLIAPQKVEFAKNLLDMKRMRKGEEIVTALIPLGAKVKDAEGNDTDARLTIAEVNDGNDFIYDTEAVEQYGWIFGTQIWDDVTLANNLLQNGQEYLASIKDMVNTIELTVADLPDMASFHLGTYVSVTSKPHGINQNFLVNKLSINLLEPESNRLTLGSTTTSFAEVTAGIGSSQDDLIHTVETIRNDTSQAIQLVERNLMSSIVQASDSITQTVSESYYLKDETDSLISSFSSSLEQTASGFNLQFDQFNAELESVASGADAQFEEIRKYIRFEDGNIILGEEGNTLTLRIENDRISFLDSGMEVAYLSNNKLYVTDGEFLNSLQLGNFAFIPRTNGNLSFKKVGD